MDRLPDWGELYDQIMIESVRNENLSDNLASKTKRPVDYADKYKSINFMFAFCALGKATELGKMLQSGRFNVFVRTPKFLGNETLLHIACRKW